MQVCCNLFPILQNRWESVSLDFITKSPYDRHKIDNARTLIKIRLHVEYDVGDRVLLSTRNISSKQPGSPKLLAIYSEQPGIYSNQQGSPKLLPINWKQPEIYLKQPGSPKLLAIDSKPLGSPKLLPGFIGPFAVEAKVAPIAYRLQFPEGYSLRMCSMDSLRKKVPRRSKCRTTTPGRMD
jgi:hypothetical protein